MLKSQELKETRANLVKRMREITDVAGSRQLTGEETQEWERINKDVDGLSNQIDMTEKTEHAESAVSAVRTNEIVRREASCKRYSKDRKPC